MIASAVVVGTHGVVVQIDARRATAGPQSDAGLGANLPRVLSAVTESGYVGPARGEKVITSLLPTQLRASSVHDLPLALAYLATSGQLEGIQWRGSTWEGTSRYAAFGVLAVGGQIAAVRGALPIARALIRAGFSVLVPRENLQEAALAGGRCIPVRTLCEAAAILEGNIHRRPPRYRLTYHPERAALRIGPDLADVSGQEGAKRALEIAAAGRHFLLMLGPPGEGKSMLARRLPGIMPPLTAEQVVDLTEAASARGELDGAPLVSQRPFVEVAAHVTTAGLIGGGSGASVTIGDVTRANHGVLYVDELPELRPQVIGSLRTVADTRRAIIGRAAFRVELPADFQLLASANECRCGWTVAGDVEQCRCATTPAGRRTAGRKYLARVGEALMNRLDLRCVVELLDEDQIMDGGGGESSADVASRVAEAVERQRHRYAGEGWRFNAELPAARHKREWFANGGRRRLRALLRSLGPLEGNPRRADKIRRVALTVADLAGRPRATAEDVDIAAEYVNPLQGR